MHFQGSTSDLLCYRPCAITLVTQALVTVDTDCVHQASHVTRIHTIYQARRFCHPEVKGSHQRQESDIIWHKSQPEKQWVSFMCWGSASDP